MPTITITEAVMPDFEYYAPETLDEALELLATLDNAKIIAGGTDVIPKLKGGVLVPSNLIDITRIKKLRYIDFDCHDGLKFGACTTLRDLEAHPVVKKKYKALYSGCYSIASTQIRNVATPVGNICNAVPSADTAPALIALDAQIVIKSADGSYIIPAEDFFTGVNKTVLRPNEMVVEVKVPPMSETQDSVYYKYAIRRAMDLAMVGVAAKITTEHGICTDARIALGAVAATPVRAKAAEEIIIGKEITEELILEAAKCASEKCCSPISDVRASKEYRREIVKVLTRDAIKNSVKA